MRRDGDLDKHGGSSNRGKWMDLRTTRIYEGHSTGVCNSRNEREREGERMVSVSRLEQVFKIMKLKTLKNEHGLCSVLFVKEFEHTR